MKPKGFLVLTEFLDFLSEFLDELIFCNDRDVELMRFLVLGTLRGSIVVDQEVGALAYASRHLSALALYVSLQLVAVLIMMYIAGYNEGQTVAGASFLYRFLFYDFQLFHQFLYMGEVGVILEPANELGALFWSDAVDAGKLVIEE